MDISSLQFSTHYTQQLLEQTATEQNKDFKKMLNEAITKEDDKELKEACVAMESYMLSMIMKQMKSAFLSEENSLVPKGDYEKMFEDYQINAQCENMAKVGGIGLADMMYKQMKASYGSQGVTNTQASTFQSES
ncbi:hypothetical protein CS063_13470 [Sporanaerobium hydrogeniformans]|uniref:Uncharacterized protein n=1 Tax=Sporanaerobium hydrogeniformans TaxID=3072179 RepID=A0AC61D9V7_9FIRM|nr:rod-binding protein [Sporanaerobium hydrogeniformans]PHV69843.1 hypothetical protein CS063_13470 [Sporanaerobium hydrogeniformans]